MHRIPNNTSEIQSPCVHSDHTSLRQDDAVSRCFDKMTLNRRGFHGLLLVKVFEQGLRVVFDAQVFRRYVAPGHADVVQDGDLGVKEIGLAGYRDDHDDDVMLCNVTQQLLICIATRPVTMIDGDIGDCLLLDLHVRAYRHGVT